MKRYIFLLGVVAFTARTNCQIADMNWEIDYQIYMKLANDSDYVYDVRDVFHVYNSDTDYKTDYVFYPVNPGRDYKDFVHAGVDTTTYNTLWSALHAKIGGGWVHFTNCLAYALETRKIDLKSPLMKRPESDWKPKPLTESYKRTKNWDYFIPVSQKNAQKEYKKRLAEGNLGDLKSIPESYIELFLSTNQSAYNKLYTENKFNTLAKIDLVKILLGTNYLGTAQINYISNSVLDALQTYSSKMLPSIIIFDEFDLAAAISLDASGYRIDDIVYKSSVHLSDGEKEKRQTEVVKIIDRINAYNANSFKKRLGNYYQK